MSQAATNVRRFQPPKEPRIAEEKQTFWQRYFLPHSETQLVQEQSSKGIFLPYPLLGILVTVGALVLSGIVGLYVQVSSLSTTLLLRDSDHARQIQEIKTELAKETERRELTDLKVSDLREKQAAKSRN